MARLMGRNLKRSRRAFSPFTECTCCSGPTPRGRAAEKREAASEIADATAKGADARNPR